MTADVTTHPADHQTNLTFTERSYSVIGGLLLAAASATPRPNLLLNVAGLAAGSYLAWRGATGYCPVKAVVS